jgi:hypothetical protein
MNFQRFITCKDSMPLRDSPAQTAHVVKVTLYGVAGWRHLALLLTCMTCDKCGDSERETDVPGGVSFVDVRRRLAAPDLVLARRRDGSSSTTFEQLQKRSFAFSYVLADPRDTLVERFHLVLTLIDRYAPPMEARRWPLSHHGQSIALACQRALLASHVANPTDRLGRRKNRRHRRR